MYVDKSLLLNYCKGKSKIFAANLQSNDHVAEIKFPESSTYRISSSPRNPGNLKLMKKM